MKLDTELVDVTGYFRALGFVLFELVLEIGNLDGVSGRDFDTLTWNGRRPVALLAIQRHPGRGGIDHERSRAVRTRENDVAARFLRRKRRAACLLHEQITKQEIYRQGVEMFCESAAAFLEKGWKSSGRPHTADTKGHRELLGI